MPFGFKTSTCSTSTSCVVTISTMRSAITPAFAGTMPCHPINPKGCPSITFRGMPRHTSGWNIISTASCHVGGTSAHGGSRNRRRVIVERCHRAIGTCGTSAEAFAPRETISHHKLKCYHGVDRRCERGLDCRQSPQTRQHTDKMWEWDLCAACSAHSNHGVRYSTVARDGEKAPHQHRSHRSTRECKTVFVISSNNFVFFRLGHKKRVRCQDDRRRAVRALVSRK